MDPVLQRVGEVQQAQGELAHVEVRSARGGTPERLFEPPSAFAHRPGCAETDLGREIDEKGQ